MSRRVHPLFVNVMPEKTARIAWVPIILQAFFVVLGVVLAFAANEWREAGVRQQLADTAVATISDELVVNRAALYGSAAYHNAVMDTLIFFAAEARRLGDDAERPNMRHFSQGFSQPSVLPFTAWEAANATGAVGAMPFEHVLEFSRIYNSQERYDQQSLRVGELIFEMLFYEGDQGMLDNFENYLGILSAFLYRECELLEEYDRTLSGLAVVTPSVERPEACANIGQRREAAR